MDPPLRLIEAIEAYSGAIKFEKSSQAAQCHGCC